MVSSLILFVTLHNSTQSQTVTITRRVCVHNNLITDPKGNGNTQTEIINK